MTALKVMLPNSLAKKADERARRDGVSIDEFVSTAVAEKLSGWRTAGQVPTRARRGTRKAFERALRQVPDAPPVPGDEL